MSAGFGAKYKTARERLFDLLSDCKCHRRTELERVSGNRYTARLLELRREGYRIYSSPDTEDGHGKIYYMPSTVKGNPQRKRVKVYLEEQDAEMIVATGIASHVAVEAVSNALGSFRENKERL